MNSWELFISCRNVKGERGTGLFAVRNVSSCITLACESRTHRRTMEVVGKDEKHSFLMKYTVYSGAIPLQSQVGVKVQSRLKRAANPCCSAHAFWWQNPWDPLSSSFAAWQCHKRMVLTEERANLLVQRLCRCSSCFGQTLNLRGEFLCFQSLLDCSSLGYQLKGTEKCNVNNKLPIKKISNAALSLQGLRGFTQVYNWTFSSQKEAGQS